ncbi:aldo/keto reductase [Streptomyces sp. NPDC056987]|uniref:aldo/keto reductase n=1 Tax=Streptomyces sp. NPDC056987 TaxID=3345988 RepID=UPI0036265DD1
MRKRRFGRLGHNSSVIIYGASMLASVDQDTADRSIEEALDAGVNHFDVARVYGDAEVRLGRWMPDIRNRIFLGTKTAERTAEGAYRQISESLERLRTDHVDLIQLHAVCTASDLDRVTGAGGALEALVRARDEGLARAIGITGHGFAAPATHLEALRRFPFNSVLTPLNHALAKREGFYRDFLSLAEEVRRQDVGFMAIKAGALRNWRSSVRSHTTWYEPLTRQEHITASVAWALSHDAVTGLPSPGDCGLLSAYITAEHAANRYTADEAAAVLTGVPDYSSGFGRPPRTGSLS